MTSSQLPFDISLGFEDMVLALNADHRPGSLTSGKTRNLLIRIWAFFVGRQRAADEVASAIDSNGSRTALARKLQMNPAVLAELQAYIQNLPEPRSTPVGESFRRNFGELPVEAQLDVARVAADLLREPELLGRLAASEGTEATRLLQAALKVSELQRAVDHLRALLSAGVVDEDSYQQWCDNHSWAFGGAYQIKDGLRRIDTASIVDMLLPDFVGYRDIVELKRPDAEVVKYDPSHKTYYFSSSVARAIGQVHKYMDRLHDLARGGLANAPDIVAYHPRAIIVIGRSMDWTYQQIKALRGLNGRLHGIEVNTYDHLLKRAETILANMQTPDLNHSNRHRAPTAAMRGSAYPVQGRRKSSARRSG